MLSLTKGKLKLNFDLANLGVCRISTFHINCKKFKTKYKDINQEIIQGPKLKNKIYRNWLLMLFFIYEDNLS